MFFQYIFIYGIVQNSLITAHIGTIHSGKNDVKLIKRY